MHTLHGCACKILSFPYPTAPALVRPEPFHASALKAPRKRAGVAGRTLRAAIISKYFPDMRKSVYMVALTFYSQL